MPVDGVCNTTIGPWVNLIMSICATEWWWCATGMALLLTLKGSRRHALPGASSASPQTPYKDEEVTEQLCLAFNHVPIRCTAMQKRCQNL